MKDNFKKHQEILCISVLNIVDDYKSLLFGVMESNNGVLLVGVALLEKTGWTPYYEILQEFFRIHGAAPLTILTENEKNLNKAITKLKMEGLYLGNHILNPMCVINSALSKLSDSEQRTSIGILLMNAATTRDKDEFAETISLLMKDPVSKILTEGLLTEKNKSVFYCCTSDIFVGISRVGCQSLRSMAKSYFPLRTTFCEFFRSSVWLNAEITRTSATTFKHYAKDLGFCVGDPRLESLAETVEAEAMDRFVENYIKGVRTFKLEIDPDNESGKTYFAKSTNYESEYEMRNRQCGC